MRSFRPLPFAALPLLLASLACTKVGVELQPYHRPDAQGFVVSLHASNTDQYQVVVWHPEGHFYALDGSSIPFQAKLVGDPQRPTSVLAEKRDFSRHGVGIGVGTQAGPLRAEAGLFRGSSNETRTVTARTAWTFDRRRWEEGRPFRLVLIRGMEPFQLEKRMEIEVSLGQQVGSAEGLRVQVVSQDPIPKEF